ncbi:MAG: prephenate dehydrogenase [Acidibacillus sp.]|nr:prephenate dehydrogenase [Acidibacillus sp.]
MLESTRPFKRLCLIGCGLIGGSVALALKATGQIEHSIGVDIDDTILDMAVQLGVVDEVTTDVQLGVSQADLIVIATPISVTQAMIEKIATLEDTLGDRAIITDVAGIKSTMVDIADHKFTRAAFIGGHPMAGSEKSGITAANALLLENAVYVLTPSSATSTERLHELMALLQATGARIKILTPETHDRVVAAISHVPHIIASLLVNQVEKRAVSEPLYIELAAGGFRDITRIASSDPKLWRDTCLENHKEIVPLLEEWIENIQSLTEMIKKREPVSIESLFAKSRDFRDALPVKSTGAIRAVYSVMVVVKDVPGLIGQITTLLGESSISIRNIGILESREGDDGQLLLQFDTSDFADRAFLMLQQNNYHVIAQQ